jgi:hypothetical protein
MSNINSRKISGKAADQIARTFVNSGEIQEKTETLSSARYEAEEALQKRIDEYAMKSPARQFFDSLPPSTKFGDEIPSMIDTSVSFTIRVDTPEMTYNSTGRYDTDASNYDWHSGTDPRKLTPDAWWWFDQRALEVIEVMDANTSGTINWSSSVLDLRSFLTKKLHNHQLLIAYVQAYERYDTWRNDANRLLHRINHDIHERTVKQVLTAWPELSEAVHEYYGTQPNQPTGSPLVTPLSQVISEVTTQMITQE